ncbi:hypothetical protein A5765_12905 [Mycolicibacterium celeriflavum]|uniref:DUF4097 family beta strand repeat-containing protein n=1 Tax=Mycolicibacterium celeriflavum TaxID=1249101 RepID=UPI0007FCCBB9|nr:DUF4097 family beta strand repeat-containing protein [Mycolicibacterium celeriflavum]OBG13376.1 hypothetical protein A5765_12905 [Mycolicibacterium celeriflavum]
MLTFETQRPITATVEIAAGAVRLVAADREDTLVDVRPRDESRTQDVKAAEQVTVDFSNGTLTVRSQRGFPFPRRGAVVVDIALPSGSRLSASVVSASLIADGEYADCKLASASGDLTVDAVHGSLKADTASGDVTVRVVNESASVATASGDAALEQVCGDVKFRTASGSLSVERLEGHVNAQTASGDVKVGNAVDGGVSVQTASGDITIGVPEGTAAQLDLRTGSGTVRNTMQPSDGPAVGDRTLEVRARTGSGDVTVRRAGDAVAA